MRWIGKFLKGTVQFVGRLADQVATGGLIHNAIEKTQVTNLQNDILKDSPKGKIDYPKWFVMLIVSIPLWIVLAVICGLLTVEQATELLKNIKP